MQRIAVATWKGGPRAGQGSISTASRVIEHAPYAFASGAHHEACTSPCEMLAAAHASCLSLAIAAELTDLDRMPQAVTTEAVYSMDQHEGQWSVVAAHLDVLVRINDMGPQELQDLVQRAELLCPITRALNPEIKITLEARLEPAFALAHSG
jgi:osmotically inducible protein OsmC